MYPETDLAPLVVSPALLARMKKQLPATPEQRKKRYLASGLSEKQADAMKLSNHARAFEAWVEERHPPKLVASLLLEGLVQLRREGIPTERISREMLHELLTAVKRGKAAKDVLLPVLREWQQEPALPLPVLLERMQFQAGEEGEGEAFARELVKQNASLVREKKGAALSALMGDYMKQMKGKVSGEDASRYLREAISAFLKGK